MPIRTFFGTREATNQQQLPAEDMLSVLVSWSSGGTWRLLGTVRTSHVCCKGLSLGCLFSRCSSSEMSVPLRSSLCVCVYVLSPSEGCNTKRGAGSKVQNDL